LPAVRVRDLGGLAAGSARPAQLPVRRARRRPLPLRLVGGRGGWHVPQRPELLARPLPLRLRELAARRGDAGSAPRVYIGERADEEREVTGDETTACAGAGAGRIGRAERQQLPQEAGCRDAQHAGAYDLRLVIAVGVHVTA